MSIGPNPRLSPYGRGGGIFVLLACAALTLAARSPNAETPAYPRAAILAPTTDFAKAEKWEHLPGGTATNRTRFDADAFSQPSASLSFEERSKFSVGNGLFRRT